MFILLVFLLAEITAPASAGSNDWTLDYNDDGITIHTRVDANGRKEFKAVTVANTTVKNCVGMMDDINMHHDFMYRILGAERISRVSNELTYTYYQVDMPWPLDDRDIVSKVHFDVDAEGGVTYSMYAEPDQTPLKDGFVRIEDAEGFWKFRPLSNEQVEITYQYKSDPVGIPTWVVNLFVLSAPKETLRNMRELLPTVNYTEKNYPWYDI